jgi:hypothetical protein
MRYEELRIQAKVYGLRLNHFLEKKDLPSVWFHNEEGRDSIDHIAIKTYGTDDYHRTVDYYKRFSTKIAETELEGRYIATAKLLGSYALSIELPHVNSKNFVRNLEIMLARPSQQRREQSSFDHAGVFMERGLIPVRTVLARKEIGYFNEQHSSHTSVSVLFGEEDDEVKFTDRQSSAVVREQLRNGNSRLVHGA